MNILKKKENIFKTFEFIIICFIMLGIYFAAKYFFRKILMIDNICLIDFFGYVFLYVIEIPIFLILSNKKYPLKKISYGKKMKKKDFLNIFLIQSGFGAVILSLSNIIVISFSKFGSSISEKITLFYFMKLLLLAPVLEEFFFRLIIIQKLCFLSKKWQIIISAFIFAIPHIYSQGISQFFYTFFLGLIWGEMFLYYGNIKYVIIFHSISNFWMCILPSIFRMVKIVEICMNIIWFAVIPFITFILVRTERLTIKEYNIDK